MARITFIEADGTQTVVEARTGHSIMEEATKNGVRGIAADCGGSAACGTCRIYPALEWRMALGDIADMEREMLDETGDQHAGARLSCQIQVTDRFDGLVVNLPDSQHW